MSYEFTRRKLGDAKKAVKKATAKSTLEYGYAIAAQAKALAPVDEGQLRNSISATSLQKENLGLNDTAKKRAEPLDTTGLNGGEVYVGSNVDHAIFQEYGTVNQPAQPFLRPARRLIGGEKVATILKEYSREAMEAEFANR
jgi:HK97 gp10 family phage protein